VALLLAAVVHNKQSKIPIIGCSDSEVNVKGIALSGLELNTGGIWKMTRTSTISRGYGKTINKFQIALSGKDHEQVLFQEDVIK
jgi:hypothetical protein